MNNTIISRKYECSPEKLYDDNDDDGDADERTKTKTIINKIHNDNNIKEDKTRQGGRGGGEMGTAKIIHTWPELPCTDDGRNFSHENCVPLKKKDNQRYEARHVIN
ncbi:hypothetical protein PoB_004632700 [Plakobranchus ocellatus]|uniref:HNH endonuclease n=1 Tax=Plakobranchus ocellatus TaxID=259542 RepID=A0AAV4BKI4_9GAST|nr:hypothetical protein PoB_004632700 [Plakobranchus ocellatus]